MSVRFLAKDIYKRVHINTGSNRLHVQVHVTGTYTVHVHVCTKSISRKSAKTIQQAHQQQHNNIVA